MLPDGRGRLATNLRQPRLYVRFAMRTPAGVGFVHNYGHERPRSIGFYQLRGHVENALEKRFLTRTHSSGCAFYFA
jgi:hypothetical protein